MNYDYLTTATFYILHVYTARVVLNATPSNHQVCAVRTQLGINHSVGKEAMPEWLYSYMLSSDWY